VTAARDRPAAFALPDYLPYLINRAGVRLREAFGAELEPFGITLQMWRVLAALWSEGERSQVELADLTTIEPSTLSRTVTACVRQGLVERDRTGGDARVATVALTAKGRAVAGRIVPIALRYEAMAVAGLEPAEIRQLKQLLRRLFANLAAGSKAA